MLMPERYAMLQVKELGQTGLIFRQCLGLMARLAELGLVHCDFNEFNLLVSGAPAPLF